MKPNRDAARPVDLRSDTVTVPTAPMLAAMTAAPVGDDVYGEDPTVRALEERVAGLFGHEAALFTPTGSMANLLAVRSLVGVGQEVLCDSSAHIARKEQTQSPGADINVALVPLGTPLLAGPGAIVATMVFSGRVHEAPQFLAVGAGVVLVHVAIWLAMRFSVPILRVIRESGVLLISRIAGLLLSAIAVQLVADAVRAFIAGEG